MNPGGTRHHMLSNGHIVLFTHSCFNINIINAIGVDYYVTKSVKEQSGTFMIK